MINDAGVCPSPSSMSYRFVLTPYNEHRVIEGLSITKAGRIGLPKYFTTTHAIKRGMSAYLYWDADHRAIAVAFARKADATAYPVIFTQQYGAFITASRFFRLHHLDPASYAGRYDFEVVDADQVGITDDVNTAFVLDLGNPVARA